MSFVDIINRAQTYYFMKLEEELRSVFDHVCEQAGLKFIQFSQTRSMMGGMLVYEGDVGHVYIYVYPKVDYRPHIVEMERYTSTGSLFKDPIRTDNIKEVQTAIREMRETNA